ncbi:L,D-transpeptidase family protein [Psychrobacter cryohalolentis]|uniref:ErfK/YbiS/YcfS/YnhG n=1 Tax=Psychrobacter cryohalolentis (strain ATCC BAA-1226 / DSM 17306 / VKM B-2378 / K5) TaxID=335284 RepID=Q1QA89_PSYCK|nr:L,D-transpeptidase family protein [Psychrobacter cryohalolentis]ABE75414.1 ErfK/YbiS/YcfS/YnhG [Psychrobacter cryohalolentis K5]ASE25605.1 murein L,D-transpeptidase [Psychrobacter cryohalolentis]
MCQKFAKHSNYAHNSLISSHHKYINMMKIKPLITAISIAVVSMSAIAAPTDGTRTLPVRTADSLPSIAKKVSLNVQESRSSSVVDSSTTVKLDTNKAKSADRMTQLIDAKQDAEVKASVAVTADNMTVEELTRKDEQSDSDDISEGQAVSAPSSAMADSATDTSIKSIADVDGKKHTTLNLSNYAKQVNGATWTPSMKVNSAMTIKMQALLDWNHASPGAIDGGWGMNSKKALINFQTMQGLPANGKMDQKTWDALNKNIPANKPVLVTYTITEDDVNTNFATMPADSEAKSKMKGLYYQDIKEMFGERFHMDVRYLDKLNKNKQYKVGETITVLNTRAPLKQRINRVVANKADKTLYAYNDDKLVATYPTTVGSDSTPSPQGTFKIVNKVKMPWYKATVGEGADKKVHMLPPGPNSPVGVVWMGLSKPSYGLHGSPKPEGISRQASAGCVRLTNWDVLEVYANIENGATVELK